MTNITLATVQSVTGLLVGIWGFVSSAEWIANHKMFASGGLLDKRVLFLRSSRDLIGTTVGRLSENGILAMSLLRLACSLVIAATSFQETSSFGVLGVILLIGTSILIGHRAGYGGDGSDQMGLIVTVGYLLMLVGTCLGSRQIFIAGILLNAGQLTISYFASGLSKWLSPTWRCGAALPGVMGTFTYGHDFAAAVSSSDPRIARALCWTIFVGETVFPFLLFLHPIAFLTVLACFMFFHLSNAYFMGLNGFVWSFAATYPAVIDVNQVYLYPMISG